MTERGEPTAPAPDPGSGRTRRVVAASTGVASVALALASVVLSAVWGVPVLERSDFTGLFLLIAVLWTPVGVLLLSRQWHPAGVVGLVAALGAGASALAAQAAKLGVDVVGPVGLAVLERVAGRLWLPGALAVLAVVALLMVPRPRGPLIRVAVALGVACSALPFLANLVRDSPHLVRPPWGFDAPAVAAAADAVFFGAEAACVAIGAGAVVVLVVRRRGAARRGDTATRAELGWLAAGQLCLVVFFGPTFLGAVPAVAEFAAEHVAVAPAFAVVFFPATVLLAAIGRGMAGDDPRLNRALVGVLLTVSVVAAGVFLLATGVVLLPPPPPIAGVLGVVALTLAFGPFREWVERRIDALAYGDAAEPAQLIRRLGTRLGAGEGGDLGPLAEALRSALRLSHVELWAEEPARLLASAGEPASVVHRLELLGGDRPVGVLVASSGRRVDRRTLAALDQISGIVAVAVQFAAINADVESARRRLIEVGAEERRIVRRELGDAVAPALAQLADRLDGTPGLLADAPEAARDELGRVRAELGRRTAEVRDLARTLLPGSLDAGDLAAALAELALRFSTESRRITMTSTGTDELDPARQAALYHVVAELVLLARAETDAGRLDIRIDVGDAGVEVRADRDGVRRTDAPRLASLTARVRELGGHLAIRERRLEIGLPS